MEDASEAEASHTLRKRLELCRATSPDSKPYGLLLLMQLSSSSTAMLDRARSLFQSSLRSTDAVWLWGEGCLAVLADGLRDSSDGPMVAEKIHDVLQNPYSAELGCGTVQAWSGASVFQLDAGHSEYWWCRARSQLRRALAFGPGTCCFCGLINGRTLMA